jgi:hypothetical protein
VIDGARGGGGGFISQFTDLKNVLGLLSPGATKNNYKLIKSMFKKYL